MDITRPTCMEVDIKAFEHNVSQIQQKIGNKTKIMPVIKANAYGTYINKLNEIIEKFDIVAVATIDEAVDLRQHGYKNDIFVLNPAYIQEIDKIIEYDIIVGACSEEFIEQIGKKQRKVKIHIEIDSGMGRTGVNINNVENFVYKILQYPNIKIDGIYTHLSSADYDKDYTFYQIDIFNKSIKIVQNILGEITYYHCYASNGILNFENYYNLVRPGIILYGYESFEGAKQKIDLKPVCKLKSKIIFLKEVPANTSIGYSRKYVTNKKRKIATIPIGYADGLRRMLSDKGEIVINKKKAKIVGNICMDSFMADVSELENVKLGDEVYIWDNEIITLDEVAKKCKTINYEIMSTISNRVPRKFIK